MKTASLRSARSRKRHPANKRKTPKQVFRALRGATADRGGSDKPLKRLERNFHKDTAVEPDKSQFNIYAELLIWLCFALDEVAILLF